MKAQTRQSSDTNLSIRWLDSSHLLYTYRHSSMLSLPLTIYLCQKFTGNLICITLLCTFVMGLTTWQIKIHIKQHNVANEIQKFSSKHYSKISWSYSQDVR